MGCALALAASHAHAQIVINEIYAAVAERELQWAPDGTPYVGHGPAWWMDGYADGFWSSGAAPLGFGGGGITTNVSSAMQHKTPSLYLRHSFSVSGANATSQQNLRLTVKVNDGFIAYLNGKEIARRNMGAKGLIAYADQIAFNPGELSVIIDLDKAANLLREGTNLLAIQAHNHEASDPTFRIAAELRLGAGGPILVSETATWKYFAGVCEPSGGVFDPTEPNPEFSDWIELHNTTDAPVNLVGWSLTDNQEIPTLWTFPSTVVPARGYLVVLANGRNIANNKGGSGYYHLNFSLSDGGEYLGLYNAQKEPVDELSPEFPTQRSEASYGRLNDAWKYLSTPTPGKANAGTGHDGFTKVPDFSLATGFYDGAQSITITVETPGATIRYTTDGSEPTLDNGTTYSSALTLTKTTSVRVRGFGAGLLPSRVKTATYLIDEPQALRTMPAVVITGHPQRSIFKPYGVTTIVGGPNADRNIEAGASALDWTALTTEDYNIPINRGRAFERPASLEIIHADGAESLQHDFGLRISASIAQRDIQVFNYIGSDWSQERWSLRNPPNKPSLNLFFRGDYDGNLDLALFPTQTTEFDSLRMRAGKNDITNPFIADEFTRRLGYQATGYPQPVGTLVNLWVNGIYRGYYNLCERLSEEFFQIGYGSDENWDVIKGRAPPQTPAGEPNYYAEAGNTTAFNTLMTYFLNTDFSNDQNYANAFGKIDVTGFVDYLMPHIYAATLDWHVNNWFAAREQRDDALWRFYMWDTEWGYNLQMWTPPIVNVMTDWLLINDDDNQSTINSKRGFPLTLINDALHANPQYRLLFADRIQKHFFNGGAFTEANYQAELAELKNLLDPTMQYLTGREVDYSRTNGNQSYYRWTGRPIGDWPRERFQVMMQHFAESGLWPATRAPEPSQISGVVAKGSQITLTNPNEAGTIYYTTDGSDPRAANGSAAGTVYSGAISVNGLTLLKARVLSGEEWSPLLDMTYSVPLPSLLITEIMYHPPDEGTTDGDEYEFIELKNPGEESIDLTGAYFSDGVDFVFPAGTVVPAGGFIVVAANPTLFAQKYPGVNALGPYPNNLSNSGERIAVSDFSGAIICEATYSDDPPWPISADNGGYSLVPVRVNDFGDASQPSYWRASTQIGGSPGSEDIGGALVAFPDLVALEGGLWRSSWYGDVFIDAYPWVWHLHHSWQYIMATAGDGMWVYDLGVGQWLWTSSTIMPFFFEAGREVWLFYFPNSTQPRYFYNFGAEDWELFY